eukprot:TRINITY_DN6275_c0_g1_i1.p1 TRINITY_DN6275_c0_g1~~TRINITY_DN6275_c0_g1_i1.p1  ORF type:complete len:244 (-),score=34.66 TRINITY_DN6275_c0_g1_i1:4-735(-)
MQNSNTNTIDRWRPVKAFGKVLLCLIFGWSLLFQFLSFILSFIVNWYKLSFSIDYQDETGLLISNNQSLSFSPVQSESSLGIPKDLTTLRISLLVLWVVSVFFYVTSVWIRAILSCIPDSKRYIKHRTGTVFMTIQLIIFVTHAISVIIVPCTISSILNKDGRYCRLNQTNIEEGPCQTIMGSIQTEDMRLDWRLEPGYWIAVGQCIFSLVIQAFIYGLLEKPKDISKQECEPESLSVPSSTV